MLYTFLINLLERFNLKVYEELFFNFFAERALIIFNFLFIRRFLSSAIFLNSTSSLLITSTSSIRFETVEMCFFWLIRKVCRGRKIIRILTTHLHNMLSTAKNQLNVSFITFNKLWARIAEYSFNYHLFFINLLIY